MGRKLVMIIAKEVGDYDVLLEQLQKDHPTWDLWKCECYLEDPDNWEENFYQGDWTVDDLDLIGMEIKDL